MTTNIQEVLIYLALSSKKIGLRKEIKGTKLGSPRSTYGLLKVLKILWKTVEVYLLALQRTNYNTDELHTFRLVVQKFTEKSPKLIFTSQLGLFLGKWAD